MFQLVYNRNNIDVLNTFNWFGIVLQSNGSFLKQHRRWRINMYVPGTHYLE